MLYLVLVHCTRKFTSNGGVYDREEKLAMTRGIERCNLHRNASLFLFKIIIVGSKIQTVDRITMPFSIFRVKKI